MRRQGVRRISEPSPFVLKSITPSNSPDSIYEADLNRDHKIDIVTYSEEVNDGPAVFFGNGDGTLKRIGDAPNIRPTLYMAVADVDGDGVPDIVTAQDQGSVTVLHGNGDGTFAPTYVYIPPDTSQFLPGYIAVVDVNHDGLADLVFTDVFISPIVAGCFPADSMRGRNESIKAMNRGPLEGIAACMSIVAAVGAAALLLRRSGSGNQTKMSKRVYKFMKAEHSIGSLRDKRLKLSTIDDLNVKRLRPGRDRRVPRVASGGNWNL